jgi:SAM-dependent methyltransferase
MKNKKVIGLGRVKFRCNPNSYSAHRPPKSIVIKRIERIFRTLEVGGGACLDLGCGNGSYGPPLVKVLGQYYVGIDSSFEMLAQGPPSFKGGDFVNGSFNRTLPFNDAAFDAIVCIDAVHFCDDLNFTFKEVGRVLAPGGLFVISTHTKADLERQVLGAFFPETVAFEVFFANRLEGIGAMARKSGLSLMHRHVDIETFRLRRAYVKLFEKKCASALHFISRADFIKGMCSIRRAVVAGRRVAKNSYTTFVFRKIYG